MTTKKTNPSNQGAPSRKPKTHIMVTLLPTTRKQIEALAVQEQRSLSYLCRHFIEQGLNVKKSPVKKQVIGSKTMTESITPAITITIEGDKNSGKSKLLHLIGYNLLTMGFNVQCFEKFICGSQTESCELKNISPVLLSNIDSRLIEISAVTNADEKTKNGLSYTQLTKAAQKEISRLIKKSREKNTIGEDSETYRNWAYGVFLGWKAITHGQRKTKDLALLEALATEDHPF